MIEKSTSELRWPREEDKLFRDEGDAVHISQNSSERFYRLPLGYKRAGDVLLEQALLNPPDRGNLIFPALFCYRHSLELFLKKIINAFGAEPCAGHELEKLWGKLLIILKEREAEDAVGAKAAGRLILEMHKADQQSDGFRYPANLKGAAFPFGDRGINIENLRDAMDGLARFLECFYLEFSNQDDSASDAVISQSRLT